MRLLLRLLLLLLLFFCSAAAAAPPPAAAFAAPLPSILTFMLANDAVPLPCHCIKKVQEAVAAEGKANGTRSKGKGKDKGKDPAAPAPSDAAAAALPPTDLEFRQVVSQVFVATSGAGRAARRLLTKVLVAATMLAPESAAQVHAAQLQQIVGAATARDAAPDDAGRHARLVRSVIAITNVLEAPPTIPIAAMSKPDVLEGWLGLLSKALKSAASAPAACDSTAELHAICRAAIVTFQKLGGVFDKRMSGSSQSSQFGLALTSLAAVLSAIAADPEVGPDTMLLAGMAIGYMLKMLKGLSVREQAAAAHAVLFQPIAVLPVPWLVPIAGNRAELTEIAAVRGALSVLDKQVLLSSWDQQSAAQGRTLLFDVCFPRVQTLCQSKSPVTVWLAHSSLALWVSTASAAAKKHPEQIFAVCNFLSVYAAATGNAISSRTLQPAANAASGAAWFEKLTNLIWESWEHPVQEIRKLTKTMFADLLVLLESQSVWARKVGKAAVESLSPGYTYTEVPGTGFCELLASRLAHSQWHVKGRYGLLCSTVTRLGMKKLLELAPSLLGECVQCLSVNSLAPQGLRLISDLSKAARKEWEIDMFGSYKGPLTTGAKTKAKANRAELEAREAAIVVRWNGLWKGLLLGALTGSDAHTRTEVTLHWLPETMTLFPGALKSIVVDLCNLLGYASDGTAIACCENRSSVEMRSRHLHALMITIKSARGAGLVSSHTLHGGPKSEGADAYAADDDDESGSDSNHNNDEDVKDALPQQQGVADATLDIVIPYELVQEALNHSECQVQMAALAFVCCDQRSTAEITAAEIALLREYVPRNLNMSDAGGRHQFVSFMKAALSRLRDSWVSHNIASDAVARKLAKHDLEHGSEVESDVCIEWICEMDEHEDALVRIGDLMVETVDWLASITIASLYPGASYQRSLTSILLFRMVYSLFNRSVGEADATWPEWPDEFPDLDSIVNMTVLISAVFNSHDDVKTVASDLLARDFSQPLRALQLSVASSARDADGCLTASAIANAARSLAASGKPRQYAVGAELFKVIFANFVINRHGHFVVDSSSADGTTIVASIAPSMDAHAAAVSFATFLLDLIQEQLVALRADLASASRTSSPNGLIFAFRNVWTMLASNVAANGSAWQTLATRTVDLVLDVGSFALSTLLLGSDDGDAAGDVADPETAPSVVPNSKGFPSLNATTDYGTADDALDHAMRLHSSGNGGAAGAGDGNDDEKDEHARIFVEAMAWRTVKEASLFLGSMFDTLALPGESDIATSCVDAGAIERIGMWMHRVLLSSRHRGVIETCADGFGKLCNRLAKSKIKEIQRIPATWFESCIVLLTADAVGHGSISITRRGAGLPHVLHAIVSNERSPTIVGHAFAALLKIAANQRVPDGWDETMDLPAVRALNTLAVLFRDANLGDAAQPFVADALIIAINGFSASEWALANTCMMLFGTLAQKMLGTKRVKDDRSHINLITAREFFSRYPVLRAFIREKLHAIVAAGRDGNRMGAGAADEHADNRLVDPELYPLLTLLSRLQSNPEADPKQAAEMQVYVELLAELTGNCIFAIRSLAARALVPMVASCECGRAGIMWLSTLPAPGKASRIATNGMHGALLSAQGFLSAWLAAPLLSEGADATANEVMAAVASMAWLFDPSQNRCALIAAAYGAICNMLFSASASPKIAACDLDILADALRAMPLPETFAANHHKIGDWWHQTAFAEVVWMTRIVAPAGTDALRSQILAKVVQTGNADVRKHAYSLAIRFGASSAHLFPADAGNIVAHACYRELANGDAADGCKTVSVEALVAVGCKTAIEFPIKGTLSAATLRSCLLAVDQQVDEDGATPPDERLQEACIVAQGMILSAVVAETRTLDDVFQVAEQFLGLTLRAPANDAELAAAYGKAVSVRLAKVRSILLGIDSIFDAQVANESSSAMASVRVPVLKLLSEALQDEDEGVRSVASATVAKISSIYTGMPAPSLHHTVALEWCFDFMRKELLQAAMQPTADSPAAGLQRGATTLAEAWGSLMQIAVGHNVADAFGDSSFESAASNSTVEGALFAKEDSNTYVERMHSTQLAVRCACTLLAEEGHGDDGTLLQQPCQLLKDAKEGEESAERQALLSKAVHVAEQSCEILLRHLHPKNDFVDLLSGGFNDDGMTGRSPTFVRVYRGIVGLASSTYAVGVCLHAADPDGASVVAISKQIPMLADTVEVLRAAMDVGKLPVVLRLAAFELRTACGSWAPKVSAGIKAYTTLLSAQVAALATPGGTDEQQAFLRMLVDAVALEGDGEPLGIFGGKASPYTEEGGDMEAAFECPFRYSIPWNFLSHVRPRNASC